MHAMSHSWPEKECTKGYDILMSLTATQKQLMHLRLLEEPGWDSVSAQLHDILHDWNQHVFHILSSHIEEEMI